MKFLRDYLGMMGMVILLLISLVLEMFGMTLITVKGCGMEIGLTLRGK